MIELPVFLPILIAILILRAVLGAPRAERGQAGVSPGFPPVWPKLVWEVA